MMEFFFLKNTAQYGQSFFFLPFFLQFFIYQKWCNFFFQFKKILKSSESWLKKTLFFSEIFFFASFSKNNSQNSKNAPQKTKKRFLGQTHYQQLVLDSPCHFSNRQFSPRIKMKRRKFWFLWRKNTGNSRVLHPEDGLPCLKFAEKHKLLTAFLEGHFFMPFWVKGDYVRD